MTNPAPGWYEDPSDSSQQRYWDGNAWTQDVQANPDAPSLIVATAPQIPGYEVAETLGLVIGTGTVMMRVFNSTMSRDAFGKAESDLMRSAKSLGANAVISAQVSMQSNENSSNTVMIVGTAVKIQRTDNSSS